MQILPSFLPATNFRTEVHGAKGTARGRAHRRPTTSRLRRLRFLQCGQPFTDLLVSRSGRFPGRRGRRRRRRPTVFQVQSLGRRSIVSVGFPEISTKFSGHSRKNNLGGNWRAQSSTAETRRCNQQPAESLRIPSPSPRSLPKWWARTDQCVSLW